MLIADSGQHNLLTVVYGEKMWGRVIEQWEIIVKDRAA